MTFSHFVLVWFTNVAVCNCGSFHDCRFPSYEDTTIDFLQHDGRAFWLFLLSSAILPWTFLYVSARAPFLSVPWKREDRPLYQLTPNTLTILPVVMTVSITYILSNTWYITLDIFANLVGVKWYLMVSQHILLTTYPPWYFCLPDPVLLLAVTDYLFYSQDAIKAFSFSLLL